MPRPTASTSGEYTSQLATRWLSTQQAAFEASTRHSVQTCHSIQVTCIIGCQLAAAVDLWLVAFRGENRPGGGWIFIPDDTNPEERCVFCWIMNTDIKVCRFFCSQWLIFISFRIYSVSQPIFLCLHAQLDRHHRSFVTSFVARAGCLSGRSTRRSVEHC